MGAMGEQSMEGKVLKADKTTITIEHNGAAIPLWVSSSTSWGLFGDQLSFTYTLTGETMTLQLKDARTVQYPSWSPDGRRLAYSSFDGVHILTLQRQVSPFSYTVIDSLILETGGFYSDSPLAWAPGRQELAFGTQDSRVLIVTLDGSRYFLGDH